MSEVVKLFEPFPKQQEFIEAALGDEFDFILYGGAIRGGKTFGGLAALILLSRFFKGSRWAVVRKDLPTLKRTTIPSFKKIVPTNFLLGGSLATGYNQTDQVVTFKNGSQIIFFPENFVEDKELNRWKGLEVNGFLLEEINELHERSTADQNTRDVQPGPKLGEIENLRRLERRPFAPGLEIHTEPDI
jgi:hypothetical protein